MVYWLTKPHAFSIRVIYTLAMACVTAVIYQQHHYIAIFIMIVLIGLIVKDTIKRYKKTPSAISYHKTYWRLYYSQQIKTVELVDGFVLGPCGVLRFINHDDHESIRIGLLYWDIHTSETNNSGSWNQLATVVRYSNHSPHERSDYWLL